MSTISDPQFKGAVLTSTLTTALLTAAAGTRIKIDHITISNGATAGTVTLSRFDSSASASYKLLNAQKISANTDPADNPLELMTYYLEAGDELRGGAATTTDAEISIDYFVITL